jgi:hypothetical protein
MAPPSQSAAAGLIIRQKEPGRYTLTARAKSADGSVRPGQHDPNCGSHVIHRPLLIEVVVDHPGNHLL